jgi:hypothetical protein
MFLFFSGIPVFHSLSGCTHAGAFNRNENWLQLSVRRGESWSARSEGEVLAPIHGQTGACHLRFLLANREERCALEFCMEPCPELAALAFVAELLRGLVHVPVFWIFPVGNWHLAQRRRGNDVRVGGGSGLRI